MTDFKDLVQLRRSHRKFTEQEIDAEDVKLILRAALMAPTSKGQRAWQFVVVDDKTDIEKLSDAKDLGGQFLKEAPLCIVVLLAAAVAGGETSEETLETVRKLHREAQWFFDFCYVENSEGAHTSELSMSCLDTSEAKIEQALALLGA